MTTHCHTMHILHSTRNIEPDAERVLRSLPLWFGQEQALQEYVRDTSTYPSFLALEGDAITGFITLKQHFPQSAEVSCIAVQASRRGHGVGLALMRHVQAWCSAQGVRFLQVKTLADSHPSPEYAQTRAFYQRLGFTALECFASLWGERTPCLQLIKHLPDASAIDRL